jgi:hypothetical protein
MADLWVPLHLAGRITVATYEAGTHRRAGLVDAQGRLRAAAHACGSRTGKPHATLVRPNVVTSAGKTALLHLLGTDAVASAGIQYVAVGTGAGTPAASDVALFSELARQATAQVVVSGSTLTVQVFFSASQANGTWTEVGVFGNGATSTAGSGTLFGHAALSYTKTTALETIVAYSLSLDGASAASSSATFPFQTMQSGSWYSASNNASTSASLGNGTLRVAPLYIPNACTLAAIAAEVTGAGSTGSVVRLGIYNDNGSGFPGSLLLDAGTINGTSATVQSISISQALGPGLYWIGGVLQGAPVTDPTLRTCNVSMLAAGQFGIAAGTAPTGTAIVGYQQTGITSTLATWTGTLANSTGTVPRVMVKVQ